MFMPIPDTWIKKYHYWIRAYGPLLFPKRSTLHKFYRLFKPDKKGDLPLLRLVIIINFIEGDYQGDPF